jgi:capsular polysaccharide transport system permease protein
VWDRLPLPQFEWLGKGLPQRRRGLPLISTIWFCVAVVAPVLIGGAYYAFIASPQYVCEFHYVVRQPLPDASVSTNASVTNSAVVENMSAILGKNASNGSTAADSLDNYMVADYITSPQAARDLDQRLNLRQMFSRAGVDPFSRLGPKKPVEKLESYWRSKSYALYDPATGLGKVRVRAFSAADAYAIATALVDLSNSVVNSAGKRSRADSVRYAQIQEDQALSRLTEVRARLAALRAQNNVIDPDKSVVPSNVTQADTLRNDLTALETRLAYLSSQLRDPSAPQLQQVKAQIAAAQARLKSTNAAVGQAQQSKALAGVVGEFEQLDDERQSAEQAYLTAVANRQQAVAAEGAERTYVATYVAPAAPSSSTYPNRLADIGLLLLASGMIWLVGVLVAKSVAEHGR